MSKASILRAAALLLASAPLFATAASAHITLERKEAPAGSYFKAVFAVPHGCDGSATKSLRVQLPEGVTGVKPMQKTGWSLATVKGKLAQPISDHGRTITERVTEIAWTGGSLSDEFYDEFVVMMKLPDRTGPLFFPTVQECETGVSRWIEIPAAGKNAGDYRTPAPGLVLQPKAAGAH